MGFGQVLVMLGEVNKLSQAEWDNANLDKGKCGLVYI